MRHSSAWNNPSLEIKREHNKMEHVSFTREWNIFAIILSKYRGLLQEILPE